jgi:hypothetical protein
MNAPSDSIQAVKAAQTTLFDFSGDGAGDSAWNPAH